MASRTLSASCALLLAASLLLNAGCEKSPHHSGEAHESATPVRAGAGSLADLASAGPFAQASNDLDDTVSELPDSPIQPRGTDPVEEPQTRPVTVKEPETQPGETQSSQSRAAELTIDSDRTRKLTEDQIRMLQTLQKKNLNLVLALRQAEERNLRLTKALIESRDSAGQLQGDLNRSRILMEIQKRQLTEARQQLARQATTRPATTPADTEDVNPIDAVMELGIARKQLQKLQLQLQLAAAEDPDERNRKLLDELEASNKRIAELEAMHRKLSRLVVQQHEQLRQHKRRETTLEKDLTDMSERLNRMETELRQTQQVLAQKNAQLLNRTSQDTERQRKLDQLAQKLARKEKVLANKERLLKARKVQLDRQAAALEEPPATPGKPAPIRPLEPAGPGQPLSGTITAVNDPVIVVSLGSRHGLQRGMRLIVYRKAQLIGLLNVDEVGPGEAACSFTRKLAQPQVGDRVIDRLD